MNVRGIVLGISVAASALSSWGCTEILLGDDVYVDDGTSGSGGDPGTTGSTGSVAPPGCDPGWTTCGTACVLLESDPLHCGECDRDCLGSGCNGGLCEPAEIGSNLSGPRSLALDGSHVYWTNSNGTVQRAPKVGGDVETLADEQESPGAISVDATALFWVNEASGKVMRMPKDVSEKPKNLIKVDGLRSLATDSEALYLARKQKKGEIQKLDKDGSSSLTLASDQPLPSDISFLGGLLVWTGFIDATDDVNGNGIPDGDEGLAGGCVRSIPYAGAEMVPLAAAEGEIVGLAMSAGTAIWADGTHRRIRARTMASDAPVTLVSEQDVRGLAADGASVVWTTSGGTVRALALAGGAVRLLAIDIASPGAVAVDESHVYFVRRGDGGAVLRVAK